MRTKYFIVISPNVTLSTITKLNSYCAIVPNSWIDKDVYVYFSDGWIEHKIVKVINNRGYIPVASMYHNDLVLVRLKDYHINQIICKCGCNEKFFPKYRYTKYKPYHYVNILNKTNV